MVTPDVVFLFHNFILKIFVFYHEICPEPVGFTWYRYIILMAGQSIQLFESDRRVEVQGAVLREKAGVCVNQIKSVYCDHNKPSPKLFFVFHIGLRLVNLHPPVLRCCWPASYTSCGVVHVTCINDVVSCEQNNKYDGLWCNGWVWSVRWAIEWQTVRLSNNSA